jgi:hypothetical protein
MASLQQQEVRTRLANKFEFEQQEGANHHRYKVMIEGKLLTTIEVSRNKNDIGQPLLGMMAKQAKVSSATFVGMISCTVSKEDYFAKVTPILQSQINDAEKTSPLVVVKKKSTQKKNKKH